MEKMTDSSCVLATVFPSEELRRGEFCSFTAALVIQLTEAMFLFPELQQA